MAARRTSKLARVIIMSLVFDRRSASDKTDLCSRIHNEKDALRMKIISTLVLTLSLLAGCTSIPPVDFTVQDVGVVDDRKDVELKSLTVGFAPQDQQGKVEVNASFPPVWKEALQDAINRSLIFKDDVPTKVNISVRITEFNIPAGGIDMKTTVSAIYEIVDRGTGDLLFTQKISSVGVVPFDYAFVGAVRAVESWNRAVRNNIADFINLVGDSDLTKPVFEK